MKFNLLCGFVQTPVSHSQIIKLNRNALRIHFDSTLILNGLDAERNQLKILKLTFDVHVQYSFGLRLKKIIYENIQLSEMAYKAMYDASAPMRHKLTKLTLEMFITMF